MKVIIAGGRDVNPTYSELEEIVKESGFQITEVVNGRHWEGVDYKHRFENLYY